jgi:hypothetical protein
MIRPRPPPNRPWTVDGARARSRVAPPPVAPLPAAERRRQRSKARAGSPGGCGPPTTRRREAPRRCDGPCADHWELYRRARSAKPLGATQTAVSRAQRSKRSDSARRHRPPGSPPAPVACTQERADGRARARATPEGAAHARADRRRGLEDRATLGQAWVTDRVRNPQCAFEMSMFMCPAVHMSTRILRRSSSTHVPSDPPFGVVLAVGRRAPGSPRSRRPRGQHSHDDYRHNGRPHLFDLWLSVFVWVRFGERARTRAQAVATGVCTANSFKTWALPREGARRYRYRDLLRSGRRRRGALAGPRPDSHPPPTRRGTVRAVWALAVMILPQVHLRKPCYDFYFL